MSASGPEIIVQFGIKNTYILTQLTVNIVKFEIIFNASVQWCMMRAYM